MGASLILAAAYLKKAVISKQVLIGSGIIGALAFLLLLMGPKIQANLPTEPGGDSQLTQARQSDAKNSVGALIRAQPLFHIEKQQFSNSIEDLGVTASSQYYEVEIPEVDSQKVIVKAFAKENGLRSYAGGVSFSNEDSYKQITCETNRSTKDIATPILNGSTWTCGSDSSEVE